MPISENPVSVIGSNNLKYREREFFFMRLATLFSGGKDSTYSTYRAMDSGNEIVLLVTMVPKRPDSWMFHHPCIELTRLQAESIGIEQLTRETGGEKEKELSDLRSALNEIRNEIDGIVTGAVASNYQKSRIDKICGELGLVHVAPLWGRDEEGILLDEVNVGLEIIFTGVYAEGLDEKWLGRKIDKVCIEDLKKLNRKYGIHLTGEGGCYETLVLDCPLFRKRIQIQDSHKIWERSSGYLQIDEARLVAKSVS
ncbi:MAG: diphthine--ammonia ligase [Promethearchaeati archaeon SRVP18_Atabeyarchaeia-1]